MSVDSGQCLDEIGSLAGSTQKYFESYNDIEVHSLMVHDKPRTEAYRDAILSQKNYFKDKVVMDVGAGTGILSVFCAQAGAKKVYAVEASSIADLVPAVARENKFEEVIEVLRSRVEDVDLPGVKVDVIVSEWMGFYLLHEGMLDSVICARDRFLKPDGKMFPQSASLWASPCSLPAFHDRWADVCGVKMAAVGEAERAAGLDRPRVTRVEPGHLLCAPALVRYLDLHTVTPGDLDRVTRRSVSHAVRDGTYQGLCVTWDCSFPYPVSDRDSAPVVLSTGTEAPPTHWQQTAVVLPGGLAVEEGAPLAWELILERSPQDPRRYCLSLEMLDPDKEEHPKPCGCHMTKCIVIRAFLEQLGGESSSGSDDSA